MQKMFCLETLHGVCRSNTEGTIVLYNTMIKILDTCNFLDILAFFVTVIN